MEKPSKSKRSNSGAESHDPEADAARIIVSFKKDYSAPIGGISRHYCSVCSYCPMDFPTGTALGGHVSSVHAQPAGHRSLLKSKSVCYVCQKVFPTDKALHGHMRSHPERPFRGMKLPAADEELERNREEVGSYGERTETDVEEERPVRSRSSPAREKRRLPEKFNGGEKKYEKNIPAKGFDRFKMQDSEPTESKTKKTKSSTGKGPKSPAIIPGSKSSPEIPISSSKDSGGGHRPNEASKTEIAITDAEKEKTELEKQSKGEETRGKMQESKLGLWFRSLPSSYPASKLFKCPICGKEYSSHQALGGHVASHNKARVVIVNAVDKVEEPSNKKSRRKKAKGAQQRGHLSNGDGGQEEKGGLGLDLNRIPSDDDNGGEGKGSVAV